MASGGGGSQGADFMYWKGVPLYLNLVPVLEGCMEVSWLAGEELFLLQDEKGIRPPTLGGMNNPRPGPARLWNWTNCSDLPDRRSRFSLTRS
jgi:hypothetical protein